MRATACLGLPLIVGRLKSKKAACTTYFPCRTLNPNSHPILSSRGRELERGQQAARLVFWVVRELRKVAATWRMPSPQPSPTGEGVSCGGFRRCRSSEKECPKHQQRNFSGNLYRKADGTNAARFFQTTFELIGKVCAARHSRRGLGLQGKWGTHACVPHTHYMPAKACLRIYHDYFKKR